MKQLDMTPELEAQIKAAVGPDVDTAGFAVFEAIAINNRPLPGKRGTIWDRAIVTPLTLKQMVDHINNGGHLPLISDHDLSGAPKGRVFAAGLDFAEAGSVEMRVLFYLDATEGVIAVKLNAGSLDEVSVKFLSSQMLCSECGFDYFGSDSTARNIYTQTCANDHTVGEDGIHVSLVGLNQFVELSLVSRGAADKPKIIGKSASKLKPAGLQLAARGFEVDDLICQASRGEEEVSAFDPTTLITQLSASNGTLSAEKTRLEAELSVSATARTAAETQVTALTAQVADLETQLGEAQAKPNNEADYQVAVAFLGEVLSNVLTASGAEAPAELPKTVAELTAAIKEKTSNLTAILPVGGVAEGAGNGADNTPALVASAFTNRKL